MKPILRNIATLFGSHIKVANCIRFLAVLNKCERNIGDWNKQFFYSDLEPIKNVLISIVSTTISNLNEVFLSLIISETLQIFENQHNILDDEEKSFLKLHIRDLEAELKHHLEKNFEKIILNGGLSFSLNPLFDVEAFSYLIKFYFNFEKLFGKLSFLLQLKDKFNLDERSVQLLKDTIDLFSKFYHDNLSSDNDVTTLMDFYSKSYKACSVLLYYVCDIEEFNWYSDYSFDDILIVLFDLYDLNETDFKFATEKKPILLVNVIRTYLKNHIMKRKYLLSCRVVNELADLSVYSNYQVCFIYLAELIFNNYLNATDRVKKAFTSFANNFIDFRWEYSNFLRDEKNLMFKQFLELQEKFNSRLDFFVNNGELSSKLLLDQIKKIDSYLVSDEPCKANCLTSDYFFISIDNNKCICCSDRLTKCDKKEKELGLLMHNLDNLILYTGSVHNTNSLKANDKYLMACRELLLDETCGVLQYLLFKTPIHTQAQKLADDSIDLLNLLNILKMVDSENNENFFMSRKCIHLINPTEHGIEKSSFKAAQNIFCDLISKLSETNSYGFMHLHCLRKFLKNYSEDF